MKIGPTNSSVTTTVIVQQKQQQIQENQIAEKKDSVEISQSGREKLKELADSYNTNVRSQDGIEKNISPKLARIKNKIEAGFYDLDKIHHKIVGKLADNIIDDIDNSKMTE